MKPPMEAPSLLPVFSCILGIFLERLQKPALPRHVEPVLAVDVDASVDVEEGFGACVYGGL